MVQSVGFLQSWKKSSAVPEWFLNQGSIHWCQLRTSIIRDSTYKVICMVETLKVLVDKEYFFLIYWLDTFFPFRWVWKSYVMWHKSNALFYLIKIFYSTIPIYVYVIPIGKYPSAGTLILPPIYLIDPWFFRRSFSFFY